MQVRIQSYQDPFGPNNHLDTMFLFMYRMQCLVIASVFALQLHNMPACILMLLLYWVSPGMAVDIIKKYLHLDA